MPNTFAFADQINNTMRGVAIAAFTPWAGLYLDDPRAGGLEISAAVPAAVEYIRQQVSFGPSLNGVMVNSADILYALVETEWGVVKFVGINDAISGGSLKRTIELVSPLADRTMTVGRRMRIPAASLQLRSALAA